MQFIAECGIEYGLQFVTQFFLNPPDCLYTKKFCDFLQSYEKTSKTAKGKPRFSFAEEIWVSEHLQYEISRCTVLTSSDAAVAAKRPLIS
jgi:hypothetical protein